MDASDIPKIARIMAKYNTIYEQERVFNDFMDFFDIPLRERFDLYRDVKKELRAFPNGYGARP